MSELPGDIQIDMAIRKLGFAGPCLDDVIRRKVTAWMSINWPEEVP